MKNLFPIRLFVLLQIAVMFFASSVCAETMSAKQAFEAATSQEIILLDIRTPGEWKQSGVGEGAWPLDLKNSRFAKNLFAIMDANPDKKIGLICATGGRSGYVIDALEGRGMENIIDVEEGMFGSAKGQGWLKHGLPTVPMDKALAAVPADYRIN